MFYDGDDEDNGNGEEPMVEAGDYDPSDEIGTRIGEHEEDPSL